MSHNAMTVPGNRGAVLADRLPGTWVRDVTLVAGFVVALGVSAQIAVPLPFTPVPITMQTFVVLLGAATLGARRSVTGAAVYAGLGVAGAPWFAITGGATLGYIMGFIFAAALVGRLARSGHDRRPLGVIGLMVAGNLVIYGFGVPVLAAVAGLGIIEALVAGVVPFLIGDALKIVLAVAILPSTWHLVSRRD